MPVSQWAAPSLFQSSPAPKGRCNLTIPCTGRRKRLFQSSPAPKGRCNHSEIYKTMRGKEFQSSPAPKGRCNISHWRTVTACESFNPHRPRRAGATIESAGSSADFSSVSILTGPEGPVQLSSQPAKSRLSCFNPHRPRRAGATPDARRADLPQPVSILTGPEGPVQRACRPCAHPQKDVSILTGPEGPVQRGTNFVAGTTPLFQSSPAPKGRCNRLAASFVCVVYCFNPHRPRRAGATGGRPRKSAEGKVSILTGPEGPVQRRKMS